jgi:hypothetical protein
VGRLLNLTLTLALFASPASAGAAAFRVRVDVAQTPDAAPYIAPVKALVEEWYPKTNDAIFAGKHPLPFAEVVVIFQPKLAKGAGPDAIEAAGFADENTIRVNFGQLARTRDDYRPLLVHELVHVVQHYPERPGTGWLVEGIADYVRHKYFDRDLAPKLRELDGYPYDQVKLRRQGYRFGYTVAAAFLYWLELQKSPAIITTLNQALRAGTYSPSLFEDRCGVPLDALWREFIFQSAR